MEHWFGTDELGRDIFTRILYGGRVSLAVGLFSTFLSIALGVMVGSLSGYFGGWVDSILMRITDAFLTFPTIFVLIILGAFLREQQVPWLKNSVVIVIIIIAVLAWMWPARLVRGLFLVLREREFVTASRALGGSHLRIIVRHILPNCIGPILVSGTLQMASAIITEFGSELSGLRRAAAHSHLGQYFSHGARPGLPRAVDRVLPRLDDLHHRHDNQLHRRRAARCI